MPALVKVRDRRPTAQRLQDMSKTSKRRVSKHDRSEKGRRMMREWRRDPSALDVEGVDDLEAGEIAVKSLSPRAPRRRRRRHKTARRGMSPRARAKASSADADKILMAMSRSKAAEAKALEKAAK